MGRRSWGEGSVYPASDGPGWIASLEMPGGSGGRRQRKRRRAGTKTEALRILRAMQAEAEQYGDLADGKRLVSATLDDYLRMRRRQRIAPGTLLMDEWAAKAIKAGLGHRRIAALTVQDCDRFLLAAAEGQFGGTLGRNQLRRLRQKLIKVIENDQRRGVVGRNVAQLSVLPDESPDHVARRPPRALTYDELARLVKEASGVASVLVDLSGRNGLRPAEARALRWSRVDLDVNTIRVDAQMNRFNQVAPAKTRRSHRTVRIDQITVATLQRWRQIQERYEAKAGPAWSNADDLVVTSRLGTPINQRNVYRSLDRACERAGIVPAISPYDLRHTAITLQVENGHSAHKVADWAGTSERMIADVYRHKLDEVSDLGPVDGGTR